MAYSKGLAMYVVFPDLYGINEYPSQAKYFPIDNGCVLEDTYNETLDTATIKLTGISSSDYAVLKNLNVYYTALIYSSKDGVNFTFIKRMLIDRFVEENIRVSNPFYYEYEITLFSETKLLEKVILPNISTTKRVSGNPLKVSDYLNEYIKEYSPMKRIKVGNSYKLLSIFYLDQYASNFFSTFYAKDIQLNKPTLRQAITELMIMANCIPVVYSGKISYISLSQRLSDISSSANYAKQFAKIDRIKTQQESSEYASEMSLTLDNVTNNEESNVDNFVNVCEMVGFRNNDSYVLKNADNLQIVTQYPIYNNPRVIMCFNGYYSGQYDVTNHANGLVYHEYDISDLVEEKFNWTKKPICYNSPINTIDDLKKYKNASLYFNRGSNVIQGFEQKIQYFFIQSWTTFQIEALYKIIGNSFLPQTLFTTKRFQLDTFDGITAGGGFNDLDFLNCVFFKIEYQTLASVKARIGKSIKNDKFIESIDNQTSSYSDSERLGNYEYSKVNRLGNKTKILSGRFLNYDDIPVLAQTYGDYVIYKRSIKFLKHEFIVDLFLTENYILRDYFTSVSSKIRSWAIAKGSEALERHDLIKSYAEFSFKRKTESKVAQQNSYFAYSIEYLTYPFKVYDGVNVLVSTVSNALVSALLTDTSFLPTDADFSYCLEERSYIFGNSLLFTFGFSDNYTSSKYIASGNDQAIGGWGEQDYPYVDDNGENIGLKANLIDFIDAGNGAVDYNFTWPSNGSSKLIYSNFDTEQKEAVIDSSNDTTSKQRQLSWQKPMVGYVKPANYRLSTKYNNRKDNREITVVTDQIEFCSDTNDIVFGRKFIERQKAVKSVLDTFDASSLACSVSIENFATLKDLQSSYPAYQNQNKCALVGGTLIYYSGNLDVTTGWQWVVAKPVNKNTVFKDMNNNLWQYINGTFVQINSSFSFKCYGFDEKQFNINAGEPSLSSSKVPLSVGFTVENTSDGLSSHIYLNGGSLTYASYAICDNNDNIIVAWNGSSDGGIWLNQKIIRDDYLYDGDGKVGSIVVS